MYGVRCPYGGHQSPYAVAFIPIAEPIFRMTRKLKIKKPPTVGVICDDKFDAEHQESVNKIIEEQEKLNNAVMDEGVMLTLARGLPPIPR
jgi:hypothetical protein